MPHISAIDEIEINAEPSVVFDVVSNYEKIHLWAPDYQCSIADGGSIREGAKVYHRLGKSPRARTKFTRSIDRIVTNQRLEESYIEGDLKGTGVWTFDKTQNGTRVSYGCEVRSQTLIMHVGFILLGAKAHSNIYQKMLKKLKSHCEAL